MKKPLHILVGAILLFNEVVIHAQTNNSAPYCNGGYTTGQCNQPGISNSPGNFINDFINDFNTSGGNVNITNNNSGCNALPNNYAMHCQHYLQVNPGQTITCNIRSGIIFAQGFAIFIDWNQNNVFDIPQERVAATVNLPPANTWTTLTFVIPANQPPGAYRMRVRCVFAVNGNNITPCGTHSYGETEDYTIFVGPIPPNAGVVTATAGVVNPTICAGAAINLTCVANFSAGLTFTWTGPGNYSSTVQNPTITNATPAMSGNYTVIASNQSCPASRVVSVQVIPYPNFVITPPSHTICNGGNYLATVTFSPGTNPANYTYSWSPGLAGGVQSPFSQNTNIIPGVLPISVSISTQVFSVTVAPLARSQCSVTQWMSVTINNPPTPTLTMPDPMCNTFQNALLTATPGNGVWSGNPGVSQGGVITPTFCNIGTNTVVYTAAIGNCSVSNTGSFSVSQFNTPALTARPNVKCVQDPTVNLMNVVQTTLTGVWSGPNVNGNVFNPAGLPTGTYILTYSTQSTPIASVCPAFTTIAVDIFSPTIPVLNPGPPLCNTGHTLMVAATPTGGVWFGNSGISPAGVKTPSLCTIGSNTVGYTAGQGTCVATATANFHVSQYNTAAITGTIPNLCFNSNPVNLMSIVQSTNYGVWSGVNVIGTYSFDPNGLPTDKYILKYQTVSSPVATLCPESRTIAVGVMNPPMPVISGLGPFCIKNGPVQLTVTPNTGSWGSYNYLTPGGVFIPSLAAVGNNPVLYTIGNSTCNSQQSTFITIEDFVPATIVGKSPELCNNAVPFNLEPLTAHDLGIWTGPGVIGKSFYPANTNAGSYTLTYHTASHPSGLCPDQSTLAVKVYSLAPPTIVTTGPFCNSHPPVELQVSPVGGLFAGSNNGAVNYAGLFNPALGIIGDNILSYSIASGPCIAYAQATITIEKFVSADFVKYAGPYCRNDQGVDLNSLVENPGGLWNGTGVTGSFFDPSKANLGENNVITYQTYSFPSALLCPDTSHIRISVYDSPTVSAVSDKFEGCAPLDIQLNTPSANNGKGTWNFGDGDSEPGLSVSHRFSTAGTYTVIFSYRNEVGCATQTVLEKPVIVHETPTANFIFEPDELSIANPTTRLVNLSTVLGDNKYDWTVQGLDEPPYEINPQVTFPDIGKYQVRLKASTVEGCSDEIVRIIEVKNDFNVYIPNSFTPDANDINDVFKPVFSPYGLDEKTYEFEIFDRWGHLVFRTNDVNTGWDGTMKNTDTRTMKQDSYVYRIKYRDLDGRVYSRNGVVVLLTE